MIVVDTGPIVALADRADRHHDAVKRYLGGTDEGLVTSPFVVAEADYVIRKTVGVRAELAVLEDVRTGRFLLSNPDAEDVATCASVIERYAELSIGIADASLVVLARRYDTTRVLTLDQRCFRAMRTLDGEPFTILPADA